MINRTPLDENLPDLGGGVGAGQNAEKHEEEEQTRLEEKKAGEIHNREKSITERGTFINRSGKKSKYSESLNQGLI